MRLSELQTKDVISTKDGKIYGKIIDAEINIYEGKINYLVVEPKRLVRSFVQTGKESLISFEQISKIGEDVILVDC